MSRSPLRVCTGGVWTQENGQFEPPRKRFHRCSERWPDKPMRDAWCAGCECNALDARLAAAERKLLAIEDALTCPEAAQ